MSVAAKSPAAASGTGQLPIRSMTGYASAQSSTEDGLAFTLSMKSVNHRFLDLETMRLPGEADGLEMALRKLIKEQVKRGHLDVTLHVERRAREATQCGAVEP